MITAEHVKDLRERTGAGMMECKKALVENDGDIEAAILAMRKSGQAKAAKKAGRLTAEGMIAVRVDTLSKFGILLEVNSETDFVGRDENFKSFVEHVADCALAHRCHDVSALLQYSFNSKSDETVEQARQALITKIGENIQIKRLAALSVTDGLVVGYLHGHKIGTLVHLLGGNEVIAKDLAMHVAASNPSVISPDEVDPASILKEKEVFRAQALQEGKPAPVVEKMIEGRVKKFVNEVSLLGQEFVRDPSKTVQTFLNESKATVASFIRYELGEGVEKQKTNFADEVMAEVRRN